MAQLRNLSGIDWDQIAATTVSAVARRQATFHCARDLFFVVYYFALPVLVGWVPQLMSLPVFGPINIAYLFALSQFFMAWCIAALYVRQAARWDEVARQIISRLSLPEGP